MAFNGEEREKPELLAESPDRRRRIVKDSGKTEQHVSQLVAQLFQMRVRMKNWMGIMESGSIPTLSNLEDAMKAEQTAPPSTARRKRRSESRRQFADTASTRPSPRGFGSRLIKVRQVGQIFQCLHGLILVIILHPLVHSNPKVFSEMRVAWGCSATVVVAPDL
ncbi:hypothetical protein GOBAR_DD19152 [Gossypium barbadense]|nr:hypothetical protein GOBAR_DD19152 [Gossypium barbadense]